ncbi:MAG: gliding motility lipoprotein GldB [Bacteroidia bacterium]|nr:gliding motility lipoprotein GldB [Bacteroidia bacterium]NNF31843.1 gliding motility lipoprotein GldB [Flavobacteriaceae bacterium]MBT8275286.1 gliding motility lipoprotein GldB [Bacteroidia bacterium]NNJ83264.1 gliding motility lipoprotein GldB [Flavobacteriaceae bacterium]NNK53318.1 gliding motility lipoprotein GldB [Flavobacteriaceae bacterium]
MKYFGLLSIILIMISCSNKSSVEKKIEAIPMDIEILRFDKEFASADISDLPEMKKRFPVFFPEQFHDSIWEGRMTDSLQRELSNAVAEAFPSEIIIEDQLVPLFKHIDYYFPEFEAPTVVTITSDVDYQNKAIVADTLLVLGLDTYLGAEHEFYVNVKKYVAKNLKPSQIGPDVATSYARQLISQPRQRNFLAQMIYFGKELYLKDIWLPEIPDAEKIGYSDAEIIWANENEEDIWRYFIENELLYSTDPKLPGRFINAAPFSKFYLEIDNESPGMIGRYIGWQIVRSYMKNNDVTVPQLMIIPTDEIFKNSKYKPAK